MILDGRKNHTRRIIKPQPPAGKKPMVDPYYGTYGYGISPGEKWTPCAIDDILWVRETWAEMPYGYVYRADEEEPEGWDSDDRWRPSIHMPREAARIFLRVDDIWAERIQDISGKDCVLEGCDVDMLHAIGKEFTRGVFHGIWDSTIKKKDLPLYGWDANPWVWVVEFERIKDGGNGDD